MSWANSSRGHVLVSPVQDRRTLAGRAAERVSDTFASPPRAAGDRRARGPRSDLRARARAGRCPREAGRRESRLAGACGPPGRAVLRLVHSHVRPDLLHWARSEAKLADRWI